VPPPNFWRCVFIVELAFLLSGCGPDDALSKCVSEADQTLLSRQSNSTGEEREKYETCLRAYQQDGHAKKTCDARQCAITVTAVREELAQSCGEDSPRRQARPEADKCRGGAPEGERADRKMRQGCFANTRRLPALHSPCWGNGKRDRRTNLGFTRDRRMMIRRSTCASQTMRTATLA
jgi:hypothetical protein